MIVDAHLHIWNRLHGSMGGKIPLVGLNNGMIRIGGKTLLGMPATHLDSLAPAEMAVAEFNAAGVHLGVIVQENMDGEQNQYCLETMAKYPDRFICHGLPDFFHPATLVDQCRQLLSGNFAGIKVPGGHLAMAKLRLDDPAFFPAWRLLAETQKVMAVDLSEGVGQVAEMENILAALPTLKVAIGHFAMPTRQGWPGQLMLARHPNVYIESGGIIWLYRQEGYPFPGAMAAIRQAAEKVGWDKLMWGSDWPRTMVDFTYRQSLDFVRTAEALTETQRAALLGENAQRLYGLPTQALARQPVALVTEG